MKTCGYVGKLPVPSGLSDESLAFLDYDGVLTSNVSGTSVEAILASDGDRGRYRWDTGCLNRLKGLCLDCGCRIVIASNWRRFEGDCKWNGFLNPLESLFGEIGDLVIGCLPCGRGMAKSEALDEFFAGNGEFFGEYVIFDDDPKEGYQFGEHSTHFVLTDRETGLSGNDVTKAKKILRN